MAFSSLNSIQSLSHIGSGSSPSIKTSTTITNNYVSSASWPLAITGGTSSVPIVITIGENLNLSSSNNFFIVYTDYVIFEGSNNAITFSNISNYLGLIQNGTLNSNGYSHIYVQNLNIIGNNVSSSPSAYTATYAGWFGQSYFGNNATDNKFTNCLFLNNTTNSSWNGNNGYNAPYGSANLYGGGISGAYTTATAVNCGYYSNVIWNFGGGIFGAYSNVSLNRCYAMITGTPWGGSIFNNGGGLVGAYAIVDISSCYVPNITTGFTGAATIVGAYTFGKIKYCYANANLTGASSSVVISNCYIYNNSWVDSTANSILNGVNNGIWTDVNLGVTNVPYVLSTYNQQIYLTYDVPTLIVSSYNENSQTFIIVIKQNQANWNDGNAYITMSEIYLYKNGVEVPKSKMYATATGNQGYYYPANAIDGNSNTFYVSPAGRDHVFTLIVYNATFDEIKITNQNYINNNVNMMEGASLNIFLSTDVSNALSTYILRNPVNFTYDISNISLPDPSNVTVNIPYKLKSPYIFIVKMNNGNYIYNVNSVNFYYKGVKVPLIYLTAHATSSSDLQNAPGLTIGKLAYYLLTGENGIQQAFGGGQYAYPDYNPTLTFTSTAYFDEIQIRGYYPYVVNAPVNVYLSTDLNTSIFSARLTTVISNGYFDIPNISFQNIPTKIYSYSSNIIIPSLPYTSTGAAPIQNNSLMYNNYTLVTINGDLSSNYPNITFNTNNGSFIFDKNTYDGSYTLLVYAQAIQTFGTSNYSINNCVCYISAGVSKNIINTNTSITNAWVNSHAWPCYIKGGTSSNPIVISIIESITFTSSVQYFVIQSDYITIDACNNTMDGSYNVIYISSITNYSGVFQNGAYNVNEAISPGYNNITIQNIIVDNLNNTSTTANYAGWLAQQYFGNNATNNNFNFCFNANGSVSNYGGGLVGANSNVNVYACGFNANNITNEGGGICGKSSICNIQNSYSNTFGVLNTGAGGLCGSYSTITAVNCYSIGNTQGIAGAFTGNNSSGTINNSYSIGSLSYGLTGQNSTVTTTSCYNTSSNNNWSEATALGTISGADGSTWIDLTQQSGYPIPFALAVFQSNLYSVNNIDISSVPFSTVPADNAYNSFIILSINGIYANYYPFISFNSSTGVITFNRYAYQSSYTILVYAYHNIFYNYAVNTFTCNIVSPVSNQNIVSSSIIINQAYVDNNIWPILIQSFDGIQIIISITENIILNDPLQYFLIDNDNIIIDGGNHVITFSGISNYTGLVQNGSVNENGHNSIIIQNLLLTETNSSLSGNNGWFGSSYYGKNASNNLIQKCFKYGLPGVFIGDNSKVSFNKCGIFPSGPTSVGGFIGNSSSSVITNCFMNPGGYYRGGFIGDNSTSNISNSYFLNDIIENRIYGAFSGQYCSGSISNCYWGYGNPSGYVVAYGSSFTFSNFYNSSRSYNSTTAYNTLLGSDGTVWNHFTTPFTLNTFNDIIYYDSSNNQSVNSLPYFSPPAIVSIYTNYSIISINNLLPSQFPNISINSSNGIIDFSGNTYDNKYYIQVYQNDGYGRYNINYFICNISTGISAPNSIITTTYINNAFVNAATWPIRIQGGTSMNPINIFLSEDITITNANQYFIIQTNYVVFNGNNQIITVYNVYGYPGLFQNGSTIQTPNGILLISGYNNNIIKNIILYNNGSTLQNNQGWFGQTYYGKDVSNNSFINCFNYNGDIPNNGGGIIGSYGYASITTCATYTYNINIYGGGIAGSNSNVILNNCYVTINSNVYNYAGGLVGSNSVITCTNAYINANLTNSYAGAFSGSNCSGSIYNAYFYGTINSSCNTIGNGSVTNLYYSYVSSTWSNGIANVNLNNVSTVWTVTNLSSIIIPYSLSAFNNVIYTSNNVNVKSLPYYSPNGSSLYNTFSLISVNNAKAPSNITIDSRTGVISLLTTLTKNKTYIIKVFAQNTNYKYYSINTFTAIIPSNATVNILTNLIAEDCFTNYRFDRNDTYYNINLFNYTTETYDASCNINNLDTVNYATGSSSVSLINTSYQYIYNSNLGFGINSADNLNTNGLSISFWVKTNSRNSYNITQSLFYISDTKNTSNGNVIYMRYLYNGTNQGLEIVNGHLTDSSNSIFIVNPPSLDGAWNHIVFIIPTNNGSQTNGASTSSWQLYVDNSAVTIPSFTNGSANYPNNALYNNLYIGAMPNTVDGNITNYFNGNIDDFRIYNRVLNSNEIINLYSLSINPPTNSISNGYFSNGSTNWTLYNGALLNAYSFNPNNPTNSYIYIPSPNGTLATDSLYQNITLTSGTYRLSFDMTSTAAGVSLYINIGSINIYSVISSSIFYTFLHYSVTFNLSSTQTGFMLGTQNINSVSNVSFAVSNFSITSIASQYNVPIYGVNNSVNILQLPFYSCPGVSIYTNFTINTINNSSPSNYPYITIDSSHGILQFNTSTVTNTTYSIIVNAYNSTNYLYSNYVYTATVSSSPTIYNITSTVPSYDYFTLYSFNLADVVNNNTVINYGSGLYDLSLNNSAKIDSIYIVGNGSLLLNTSSTNQYAFNSKLNLNINASTNTNTQGISICFWQKTKIFTSPQTLFYISDTSNSFSSNTINMQYAINGNDGVKITVGHLTDNSNSIFIPNSYTNDGNWHHYTLVIPDNSSSNISGNATSSPWQLYIDNVAYTLPSFTNGSNVYPQDASYQYLYIGAMPDICGNIINNFNGNIDEFYIFNRTLSVIEITNIYTNAIYNYNSVSVPPNDCYTYYRLSIYDQYSGSSDLWNIATQLYDTSMVNGTIVNGPSSGIGYTSLSLNNGNTNYTLNGTNQYVYNQNYRLTINSATSTNTSGLSFSFWAKMNANSDQSFFSVIDISNVAGVNNYNMINMRYLNTGAIEIVSGDLFTNKNDCYIYGFPYNTNWNHFVFIIPDNNSSTNNRNATSSTWNVYINNIQYPLSFSRGGSYYPSNSVYNYLMIGARQYNVPVTLSLIAQFELNNTTTDYVSNITDISTSTITYNTIQGKTGVVCNGTNYDPSSSAYIQNFNIPSFSFYANYGVTISLWFYANALTSTNQVLFSMSQPGWNGSGFLISLNQNNITFRHENRSGYGYAGYCNTTGVTINTNTWYNVVCTINPPIYGVGMVLSDIYVNSVIKTYQRVKLADGYYDPLSIGSTNLISIGTSNIISASYGFSGSSYVNFNGVISKVYIYNIQLSNAQISSLYNPPIVSDYFVGNMNDFRVYNRILTKPEIKNLYCLKIYPIDISSNNPYINGFIEKFNYLNANLYTLSSSSQIDPNKYFDLIPGYQIYLSSSFQSYITGQSLIYVTNYKGDVGNNTNYWSSAYNFYDVCSNFLGIYYSNTVSLTNYGYITKKLYLPNNGNYNISFYLATISSILNMTVYLDNSAVTLSLNNIYPTVTTSAGTSFSSIPTNLINLYNFNYGTGNPTFYKLNFNYKNVAAGNKIIKIQFGLPSTNNSSAWVSKNFITGITINPYTDTDVSINFNLNNLNTLVWMDSNDNSTLFNTTNTTDKYSTDMNTYNATGISTNIYGWRNKGWLRNTLTWTNPITFYNPKIYLNRNPSSSFNSLSIYSIFMVVSSNDFYLSRYTNYSGLLGNGTTKYVYTLPNTTDISTNLQNATIYINGTQTNTVSSVSSLQLIEVVSSSSNLLTNVSIGNGDNTNSYWNGIVAEVVMFDISISILTRQSIEAYLANKWSLQYALDISNQFLNVSYLMSATGGILVASNNYNYHIFTNNSNFVVTNGSTVDYLIIGGGGAGGNSYGGGGGAGRVVSGTTTVSNTSYPIVVGNGGIASNGGDSSAFGITAVGGGMGGGDLNGSASIGGSGGGGSGYNKSGNNASASGANAITPSISNSLGNNGGDAITIGLPYILDYLSTSTKNSILYTSGASLSAGAYGLKLLYSSYSSPIISIRRSNDSSNNDFYSDINGNLGTGIGATGTSLTTWLNGANAFVSKWWDQTGNSNHAIQTNAASQPQLNNTTIGSTAPTGYYIDFTGNKFFNLPDKSLPYYDSSYSYILQTYTMVDTGYPVLFTGGGGSSNTIILQYDINPSDNQIVWFYENGSNFNNQKTSSFTRLPNEVDTYTYSNKTRNMFINGSSVSTTTAGNRGSNGSLTARTQAYTNNILGYNGASPSTYQLYYFYFLPIDISLYSTDKTILEKTGIPYTGTGGGGGGGAGSVGSISTTSYGGIGGLGTNYYSSWLFIIQNYMSSDWQNATYTGYIANGGNGGNLNPVAYIIDNLSSYTKSQMLYSGSGASSSAGALGMILLYSSYTGPAISIRNGTTNETVDFYADVNGNLGTGYLATGKPIYRFIGNATAYVTKWWDQTGNGNHATQTTAGSQPIYDLVNKLIDFNNNASFNLPNGAYPYGNSPYTYTYKHGILRNSTAVVYSGGFGYADSANYAKAEMMILETGDTNYTYRESWWGNDVRTNQNTLKNNNIVTNMYDGSNRSIFINGVSSAYTRISNTNTRNQTSGPNAIGRIPANNGSPDNYSGNTQMYYFYFIPIAISNADRIILESTPITTTPTTVVNTGSGGIGGSAGNSGTNGGSGLVVLRYVSVSKTIPYIPPIIDASNTLQYLYEPITHLVLDTTSNDTGFYPSTINNSNVTFTTVAGKQCAYFNNSLNTFIGIPFNYYMNNFTNFTFAFWVYTIDNNYYTCATITNPGFLNDGNQLFSLEINGNTSMNSYVPMPTLWDTAIIINKNNVQNWTHVAYTLDYNNYCLTIYFNGIQVNQSFGSGVHNITSALQFVLGKNSVSSRAFNGYIRQFVLYYKLLSASQIVDIYNNTM